jgi:hypothetical protein
MNTRTFESPSERWLLFFICASLTVLPLHFIDVFGYGLPFRWELTTLLLAFYAYDDARGAHIAFVKYLSRGLERIGRPLSDASTHFKTTLQLPPDPHQPRTSEPTSDDPQPPPPSPNKPSHQCD